MTMPSPESTYSTYGDCCQAHCGGCWAFSTTGSVEGAYFLATGQLRSLSEQQLIDCSTKGNKGCQGGIMEAAFQYIMANGGIDSEADYNYTSGMDDKNGVCWTAAEKRVVATINNYTDVKSKSEEQLQAAVMKNPVSVAIEADHPYFQRERAIPLWLSPGSVCRGLSRLS